MSTIQELSKHIRSKNAGPFWITVDVFCENSENYEKIKSSHKINQETVGRLYKVSPELVKIFFVDNIHVIKFSYPREVPQGDAFERDMHGGQQYIELSNFEI